MYNDYYLEQISTKITTTNSQLNEVLENQETLISGDNIIHADITQLQTQSVILQILVMAILLYLFVVRCLK